MNAQRPKLIAGKRARTMIGQRYGLWAGRFGLRRRGSLRDSTCAPPTAFFIWTHPAEDSLGDSCVAPHHLQSLLQLFLLTVRATHPGRHRSMSLYPRWERRMSQESLPTTHREARLIGFLNWWLRSGASAHGRDPAPRPSSDQCSSCHARKIGSRADDANAVASVQ